LSCYTAQTRNGLQFCAKRFPYFSEAKGTARDVAKNKEAEFSSSQISEIWDATARVFATMEPLLKTTNDLFLQCSGTSNTLAGIIMSGKG
jgi:hypothetical protein